MGWDGYASFASALDQSGEKELEADQLDRLMSKQVAVLPEIAGASLDRAAVFSAATELAQGGEGGQGAQDAIVLVAHAAAPAAVGELVIGQPTQRRRIAARASVAVSWQAREPGGVLRAPRDTPPGPPIAQEWPGATPRSRA